MFPGKTWIICRVCLQQQDVMINIYDDMAMESIWYLLRDCGGIPVRKDDDLPDKICATCLSKLRIASIFRRDCQRGHRDLVQMLMKTNLKMFEMELENERRFCYSDTNSISDSNYDYRITNFRPIPESQISEHNQESIVSLIEEQNSIKTKNTKSKRKQYCVVSKTNVDNESTAENTENPNRKDPIVLLIKSKKILKDTKIEQDVAASTNKVKSEKTNSMTTQMTDKINETSDLCSKNKLNKVENMNKKTLKGRTLPTEIETYKQKTKKPICTKDLILKMAGQIIDKVEEKSDLCNEKELNQALDVNKNTLKEQRKFKCKLCNKISDNYDLFRHHTYTHTKPHQCRTCKQRFSQKHSLLSHINMHAGSKPYFCRFCHKKYSDISNRNSHERKNHQTQRFKCKKCNKTFRFLKLLESHVRSHKPKVCLICNKEFASLQMVRVHHQRKHLKLLNNVSKPF